jgi:hypothetical protein
MPKDRKQTLRRSEIVRAFSSAIRVNLDTEMWWCVCVSMGCGGTYNGFGVYIGQRWLGMRVM